MTKLCRGWNYASNHSMDDEGRIIVIWKETVSLRILHQSRQAVTCEVKLPGSPLFVYTAVYASNERAERTNLWVELLNTCQSLSLDTVPWIMGGDFNQIAHYSEHSHDDFNYLTSSMVEFKDCLHQMGLYDLRFQGPLFTWTNKQPDSPLAKKLDRLLINSQILNHFPNCTAFFLPALTSDHCPCILDLAFKIPTHGTRPFKFYNYLSKHPDFLQVVYEAWIQAGSITWNLTALCWKQKQIKRELKTLNRENFSQIQKRVSEANCLLQDVQVQVMQTPTMQLFELEKQALERWNFLRMIEESYFKQRSRINWLKEGDQNTTYFYRIVQTRLSYNMIRSFILPSGVVLTDSLDMSYHVVCHFTKILGPVLAPQVTQSSVEWFQGLTPFLVTKSKKEGGLGIKDLSLWNKACCIKLIWLLFFQSGSIWVAWFVEEVLQGSLNNLWTTPPNRRFSWQINKLLKLSSLIYQCIKMRVSNGLTCRFWTDNWSSLGSIRQFLQLGASSSLGIPELATLASLQINGAWQLPPARSEAQVQIHAVLTMINLNDGEDHYEWEIDGQKTERYSIGQVYDHLRTQLPHVQWHQTVWNKSGIPRHSFLSWLFVLNRCPTRDRIISWGLATSPLCLLCNLEPESRNHLFFYCSYTWGIWSLLIRRCDLQPERIWSRVLEQLHGLNPRSPIGKLSLICWQACLYWSWTERNTRLHRQTFTSSQSLTRRIDRQIKDKILSLRSANPASSSIMMQQWLR
ncbi:hypothetical protein DY000_02043910 [Brassica cretica]|uniref:Reverse transcriptase zinc-binding domain-containing protein n=1 Tax=Brassica cretica TaxID=69181 RepID=A0ABQ7BLT9_BRACR|nr:hypothetical protein DY000_02043910 [Brassica cretica]